MFELTVHDLYLEQNISNQKLDGSEKKANTNISAEMKTSCNVKQGTSLLKNSTQKADTKDFTRYENILPYVEQKALSLVKNRWIRQTS